MDKIRTLNLAERVFQELDNMQSCSNAVKISHGAPGCVSLYNESYNKYQKLLSEFFVVSKRKRKVLKAKLEEHQKLIDAKDRYKNCLMVVR